MPSPLDGHPGAPHLARHARLRLARVTRQLRQWTTQSLRMRGLYETWLGAVGGKLWRKQTPRVLRLRRELDGAPVDVLAATWRDVRIVNELFLSDPYLGRLPDTVRKQSHPLVVDVGANRGYFCIQAWTALDHPRVIAFEPEPANLAFLRANLALNGLDGEVEIIAAAAVADERSSITLHLAAEPALHTTVGPADAPPYGKNRYVAVIDVAARNLDAELRRLTSQGACIDLLKLDTEGTEVELLASLSDEVLAATQYVVAELFASAGQDNVLQQVVERLEHLGFRTEVHADYLYVARRGVG